MQSVIKRLPLVERKTVTFVLAVTVGVVSILGYFRGGYYVSSWGLAAFMFSALLGTVAVLGLLGGVRSRWGTVAITFFTLYASWTFASVFWSANRGDAWSGSSQTLLYLVAFWVSATLVAAGASRRWAMAVLSTGPGLVAALTVASINTDVEASFELGRLLGSVGYFNAEAAFLLVSFWVGVYVAGSRRLPAPVRGAALASIVIGLEVAVLTQSRGAMVAMAFSLPVYFVFSGRRLRGLIALLPVVAALVVTFPALNGVYPALESSASEGSAAITGVRGMIWTTTIGAGVYGLAWGLLDRRWRPGRSTVKFVNVLALIAVAVVLLAGCILFVQRAGDPVTWMQEQWTVFTTNDTSGQQDTRYLSASGSGRYTLWSVAWEAFRENPVVGVGTNNYESYYYQHREQDAGWVKQPHSLPLEVLSERGIIGGLLFAGFLAVCVLSGLAKRFGSLNSEGKAQVGALLASVAYWFVHSGAEWFWQMPAVTLPAIIYLAMLVAPWKRPTEDESIFGPSDRPLRFSGLALAALALLTITPLFVANHYQQLSQNRDNPWQSLQDLERAQRFNPLDADLARNEADLAYQIGDIPLATQSYARAISLDPEHYATYSVLAGVYEQLGQPDKALELYRKSLELNKLDPTLRENVARLEQASGE